MGRYINRIPDGSTGEAFVWMSAKGKVDALIAAGAKVVDYPMVRQEWRPNLVVVVDNGAFEAAAYCHDPDEMIRFARLDGRKKTWLVVPNADKLAE